MNASKNIATEIFVVDNNSTDGSKDFFAGRFSNVTFIWNKVNVGFSKANNQAISQAAGEYILVLNPDTILPEDCLEKCIDFFKSENDIGAIGIRMIDGSGNFLKESKRAFPGHFTALYKLCGLTAMFPNSKIFARYYLGHLDQNINHEVDVLAGAFMMINKNALDKTGGFDERFFMYGEDVDLSYRIQKAGFKNIYFSETTIIHFKGESTKRGSLNYARLFYGAMSLFVKKHYSGNTASFYNLIIQAGIRIKSIFSGIGPLLKKVLKTSTEMHTGLKCFIIADKKAFDFISAILQKNNIEYEISGRISLANAMENDAVGNFDQLEKLVAQQNTNELIFVPTEFSTKAMISLIQHLPTGIRYRFHFAGTFSIVGSSRKESPGDCLAISI